MTKKVSAFLVVVLLFTACSLVPFTNRRQFKMLPESMLANMGLTAYNEFLSTNLVIPVNHPNATMINAVGDRLTGAVVEFMTNYNLLSRLNNYAWEYHLVENDDVNAWCMPGGKIVVYTGILPFTKDEAGAAVVMAHEIAHAIANHGNERMSQQLALTMGAIGLDIAISQKPQETRDLFMTVYGVGGTLGTLAYSRQFEYEADKLGMIFMAMAGYNPERALSFWDDIAALKGPTIPTFMSTHPSSADRVEAITKFMPEAMKFYNPDAPGTNPTTPKRVPLKVKKIVVP
ncbi:MAG: M48 family metallopeptidase [Bacteroidales bacterium]|nr:M48 family metallopeptidase [Bacteroidales bacterium]